MIIPPQQTPLPQTQVAQPTSPHNNAAMATAGHAAQKTAKPTETQTKKAASAVAPGDKSRENTDGSFVGYAYDNEAAAVRAQTNGHGMQDRGHKLDLNI